MLKKILLWALLAVVVVWIVHDPTGASGLAHQIATFLGQAANSLGQLAHGL